ncbi:peptide-binding protein [Paenibacillus macerans]|uniref:Bacterial extracellular solute-binding s, 5 Middle family protein n=1 Tax=Paenibacillus macerans TaxID=44252 RepID=A0A090ZNN6_PAEMA|nr:peptide-binding protein [Paenibacillus macerans]KFN12023.1 bacterial extracellular solute-binding s, 5 Middle family protein [Paenibacillus macerans]MBS5912405.1 peptide-binding protein [Paenibacillus macerans]MCY7559059.1 peptide-binding protein [Paenibacillus macerans]MDU5945585.1 peptide-binding protein [Paenibacillus macerans]MEC0136330.1 peptide-binding protein [Paenibacillus macerans]
MGRRSKLWSVLLILSLVGILFTGCSTDNTASKTPAPENKTPTENSSEPGTDKAANEPVDGGTLTLSSFSDIVNVNPILINDTSSGDVEQFIFAKLYDLDREGNVAAEPWSLAAELPQISEDSKTYTVKLKDTAKWSDGQPVTADDIIYTFDTIRNPDTGAPGIGLYDKIDKMKKVDDHTVNITLKQVYAPFQYSLVQELAPAHILKDVPVKELQKNAFGTDPAKTVTSGPWKWTAWKQGESHTLDADPNYWGAVKPHISQVIYKIYADQNTEVQALLKGDTDHISAIPVTQVEAVKANKDIAIIQKPGAQYEYVNFNFDPKNFKDNYGLFAGQKTRQAIAYALNRQGMVDNVLKGVGALMNAPFLPDTWADPKDAAVNYPYDPEKAKQLLAEDGWVAGKDGILEKDGHRFSFELQYNAGNSRREQIAAIVQQNLKDVGIEVTPKAIDFAAWIDQNVTPGKYQAILLGWSLNTPDPDSENVFSSKYFPPAGQNSGWYKNEKLDQLWVDGYSTVDQAERQAIYKEVAKEISTDLPYVFLYQYGQAIGTGPRVHWAEEDRPEPSLGYGQYFHVIKWWVTD